VIKARKTRKLQEKADVRKRRKKAKERKKRHAKPPAEVKRAREGKTR
jgi:hypothetical protein